MCFRLPALALVIFLAGLHGAHALECDKATLPSSKVLCSDPDLKALADERQRAWFETWNRLDPRQRNALTYDQTQWVRGYAVGCGIAPDREPRLPVSADTKRCFIEAAHSRLEFIRDFGTNREFRQASAPAAVPAPYRNPDLPLFTIDLTPTPFRRPYACQVMSIAAGSILHWQTSCWTTETNGQMAMFLVSYDPIFNDQRRRNRWLMVFAQAAAQVLRMNQTRPVTVSFSDSYQLKMGVAAAVSTDFLIGWQARIDDGQSAEEAFVDLDREIHFMPTPAAPFYSRR